MPAAALPLFSQGYQLIDGQTLDAAFAYVLAHATSGGGGFTIDNGFTTGLSYSVVLTANQTIVRATSATAGGKTFNIPAASAGNSGYVLVLKGTLADGTAYTITPASGTCDVATFTDNAKDSVSLISDGVSNWDSW